VFGSRTRAQWDALLTHVDACATVVLSLEEAPAHEHNAARGTFIGIAGVTQPAPAPRFSRTPGAVSRPPAEPGAGTRAALWDWGIDATEIDALLRSGALAEQPQPAAAITTGR
jgi:alpha-methylacyl-CoA racemase